MNVHKIRSLGGVETEDEWLWPAEDSQAWKWLMGPERGLVEKILPHVQNFDTVIHAGAHCGVYAKTLSRHFKRVYAIEPDPTNFYCLVHNVTEPNVIKIQAALGDRDLCGLRQPSKGNCGGIWVDAGDDTLMIPMSDLPGKLGLILLDVEGYEVRAMDTEHLHSKPIVCLETMGHGPDPVPYMEGRGYAVLERLEHDTIFGARRGL